MRSSSTPPSSRSRHEYSALPGVLQLVDVVGERAAQEVARRRPVGRARSTTRMCDTSNMPASRAHRVMLVDLRAVVDGHVPAAEVDHAGAGGAVDRVERGLLRHGALRRTNEKGEALCCASPRLSFYLRDWDDGLSAVAPAGAPSVGRCRRPRRWRTRDRSPDCGCVPCSPCCLSGFGITPSAAVARTDASHALRSPARTSAILPVRGVPVKGRHGAPRLRLLLERQNPGDQSLDVGRPTSWHWAASGSAPTRRCCPP